MSGAEIKRVYVFNDKKEQDYFLDVMKKQIKMGCGIKYIYKKDFLELPFVSDNIAIVEALDFALANDSWVFRTMIDDKGHIIKANAIKNEAIAKSARTLFQEAFRRGKDI